VLSGAGVRASGTLSLLLEGGTRVADAAEVKGAVIRILAEIGATSEGESGTVWVATCMGLGCVMVVDTVNVATHLLT